MWSYNTQQHRTVGNTPYRLLFGQQPRVGISVLHLDPTLLDTLATEAELNQLVDLPAIDDTADGDRNDVHLPGIDNAAKGNGNNDEIERDNRNFILKYIYWAPSGET
jgi:hypothetical protein